MLFLVIRRHFKIRVKLKALVAFLFIFIYVSIFIGADIYVCVCARMGIYFSLNSTGEITSNVRKAFFLTEMITRDFSSLDDYSVILFQQCGHKQSRRQKS